MTGAGSGIGLAVARLLSTTGARVFGIDKDDRALAATKSSGALVRACDVSDLESVRDTVDTAAEALGGLDGLINCAGVLRMGPIVDGDIEQWRLMVDTNLLGLLYTTHAALTHLRQESHADIVNVSSLSGRRVAHTHAAVYTATKAAVHALTDAMRAELAGHSIRTTIVAPGAVRTSLSAGITDSSLREEIAGVHASVGLEPADIAQQILNVLEAKPGVVITEIGVQSIGHAAGGAL